MEIALLCDGFGWTYQEYLEQPKWLITLLVEKRRVDSEQAKKKQT